MIYQGDFKSRLYVSCGIVAIISFITAAVNLKELTLLLLLYSIIVEKQKWLIIATIDSSFVCICYNLVRFVLRHIKIAMPTSILWLIYVIVCAYAINNIFNKKAVILPFVDELGLKLSSIKNSIHK